MRIDHNSSADTTNVRLLRITPALGPRSAGASGPTSTSTNGKSLASTQRTTASKPARIAPDIVSPMIMLACCVVYASPLATVTWSAETSRGMSALRAGMKNSDAISMSSTMR